MRHVMHRGPDGLERRVAIPDGTADSEAAWGAPAGPPDISGLASDRGWPDSFTRRLHQQLVDRGLFTADDVRRKGGAQALRSALTATLRMDVQAILLLYDAGDG